MSTEEEATHHRPSTAANSYYLQDDEDYKGYEQDHQERAPVRDADLQNRRHRHKAPNASWPQPTIFNLVCHSIFILIKIYVHNNFVLIFVPNHFFLFYVCKSIVKNSRLVRPATLYLLLYFCISMYFTFYCPPP